MGEILTALCPVAVHMNLFYFLCNTLPFSETFGNRFTLVLIQYLNNKLIYDHNTFKFDKDAWKTQK